MKKPIPFKDLERPKLTREKILEAAFHIAKEQGLANVSMRHVANLLQVKAMSLYKYIENKDDLLDGVIELVIKKIPLPLENTSWKQALKVRANSEYKILSEHAWIIHLLETRSGTGTERLLHQNNLLALLRSSGFSIELAFQTMIIVTGYVYGFVVFATAWSPKSKERAKTVKKARQEIHPSTHPYIVEAITFAQNRMKNKEHHGNDIEFNFGLDLILDSIELRLQRKT